MLRIIDNFSRKAQKLSKAILLVQSSKNINFKVK